MSIFKFYSDNVKFKEEIKRFGKFVKQYGLENVLVLNCGSSRLTMGWCRLLFEELLPLCNVDSEEELARTIKRMDLSFLYRAFDYKDVDNKLDSLSVKNSFHELYYQGYDVDDIKKAFQVRLGLFDSLIDEVKERGYVVRCRVCSARYIIGYYWLVDVEVYLTDEDHCPLFANVNGGWLRFDFKVSDVIERLDEFKEHYESEVCNGRFLLGREDLVSYDEVLGLVEKSIGHFRTMKCNSLKK